VLTETEWIVFRMLALVEFHMHDYYPVIARAVSRLERNTPEARRQLFDHIRKILIEQLRIREPPPTSSELSRERASLEAAIRRVELEFLTSPPVNRASVETHSVKSSNDSEAPGRIQHTLASMRSCRAQEAIDGDRAALEPAKVTTNRDERRQKGAPVRRLPVQEGEARTFGSNSRVAPSIAVHRQSFETTVAADAFYSFAAIPCSDDQSQSAHSSRLSDLFSIHCLDELLRAGAEQLAPESLKRDAEVILKWLAVQNSEAIKPEHYEQFTRALQTYMAECKTPDVPRVTETAQLSSSVSDDVRAIFDRMLEREQADVIFEDALTWFALLWFGLMLALNLIVSIVLIVAAPTIAAGIGKLAATYSPFNLWCWVFQVLAISPAGIAIYAKRERMRVKGISPVGGARSLNYLTTFLRKEGAATNLTPT
jgi:hypothetical protein